jgi:DNA-binding PadR family transcriptional regulator
MKSELLSKDLEVALEVYKYDKIRGEPIYLNKLVESLKERVSRGTISKALDRLFDLGILNAKWKKVNSKWVRVFYIAGEAEEFLEDVYKHVKEE